MSIYTRTTLVLLSDTPPPVSGVNVYTDQGPIGTVRLDDGDLTIQAEDPAHLLLIAEAFTDCARQLAAAADTYAAQPVMT